MIRDFEIVTEGAGEEAFGQARMTPMTRDFNVIIERDAEGYYVATVPDLRGCHTQAKSLDKLMERVREAIELCLEVEGEDEGHEELDFDLRHPDGRTTVVPIHSGEIVGPGLMTRILRDCEMSPEDLRQLL